MNQILSLEREKKVGTILLSKDFGNIRFSKESWLNSGVREWLYEPRSIKTKQKTSPEVAEMDPRAAINGYGDLVNLMISIRFYFIFEKRWEALLRKPIDWLV